MGERSNDTTHPSCSKKHPRFFTVLTSPGFFRRLFPVAMEEEKARPSDLSSSFRAIKAPNIVDLIKKRKHLSEHFDLPLPKHKCLGGGLDPALLSKYDGNPDIEDLPASKIKRLTEGGCSQDESQPESVKDSNSFSEDSDTAMSAYGGCNLGPIAVINSGASTSVKWALNISQDIPHSSSDEKGLMRFCNDDGVGKHDPPDQDSDLQMLLEEQLLEFGCHVEYTCEYANDCLETSATKEAEDSFYSNASNPIPVPSSERWNTNHDTLHGTRKPTIDQEFEDYFSTLMIYEARKMLRQTTSERIL